MSYGFGQLNAYADRAHQYAKSNGFWDGFDFDASTAGDRQKRLLYVLSKLALIGSEVGEGVEAARQTNPPLGNLEEELADVIIRCLDLSEALGFNIEQALVDKMAVNEKRTFKHGKEA